MSNQAEHILLPAIDNSWFPEDLILIHSIQYSSVLHNSTQAFTRVKRVDGVICFRNAARQQHVKNPYLAYITRSTYPWKT